MMSENDYDHFTKQGYFTIRRTHHFWSGNLTDQTIEQDLMRMLKNAGGMTHGRQITDSNYKLGLFVAHHNTNFQKY